jgi:predicted nucleic acid-binding protein
LDVLLVDSSGLLAAIDAGEPDHARVSELLAADRRPLVVTDYVVAEVDYLVLHRLGLQAEQAFIEQVLEGIFTREPVTDDDLRRALEIGDRFSEHHLGVTDATLMAISERLGARQVLTLDRRHFSVYRNRRGRALELLP